MLLYLGPIFKVSKFSAMPSRSPNHPDLVGIAPILLENPEARPICDWDKKNPDLKTCSDFFIQLLNINTK